MNAEIKPYFSKKVLIVPWANTKCLHKLPHVFFYSSWEICFHSKNLLILLSLFLEWQQLQWMIDYDTFLFHQRFIYRMLKKISFICFLFWLVSFFFHQIHWLGRAFPETPGNKFKVIMCNRSKLKFVENFLTWCWFFFTVLMSICLLTV